MPLERAPPWLLITLALLAGLTCQLLIGTSYVAASLDPLREEGGVPIAFVNLDPGPHGARLLASLRERASPVAWVEVGSRDAAFEGLLQKRFFGAMVVPSNFSADLDSFASDRPRAALIETYGNPGASTSGSLIAGRAMELAVEATRETVRERAIEAATVGSTGLGALTLDQARFIAMPVRVQHAEVNEVPPRGANGLAPTYLAMAAWIGGYLGAIALERFRPLTKLGVAPRAALVAAAAGANGALATLAALAVGLAARDALELAMLLAVGTWMAYALVALLTDVFGLAGILPAFAVLALGLPASGALYPAGLLPDLYRSLHAIDPFTWLVEGLRTTLYAPGAGDLAAHMTSLVLLALACTTTSLLLGWLRGRRAGRTA
ncbi:MAG TPA: ABC transporter permease [Candidatus Thermoplasmatota archaeon]|nr:ABC transporter permease [Candidatus Thermoplasmatota archaeon]